MPDNPIDKCGTPVVFVPTTVALLSQRVELAFTADVLERPRKGPGGRPDDGFHPGREGRRGTGTPPYPSLPFRRIWREVGRYGLHTVTRAHEQNTEAAT